MAPDRSWMTRRFDGHGALLPEFAQNVELFLNFAYASTVNVNTDGKIKCPCSHCRNKCFYVRETVKFHLCKNGFLGGYQKWTAHGELNDDDSDTNAATVYSASSSNIGQYREMIIEGCGVQFDMNDGGSPNAENEVGEVEGASEFTNLLKDVDEPLWTGCKKHTVVSATAQLMNHKSEGHVSQKIFDRFLHTIKEMLPEDSKLPGSFYHMKKKLRKLGLEYVRIDACPKNCIIFYGEHMHRTKCPTCGHARYRRAPTRRKKGIAFKVLRYLPITPRLKRLYMSQKTAPHMTWHASHGSDSESMSHPAHSEAWKHFDEIHQSFSSDARNIRLGLCTDGFSPFNHYGANYSCWPVILTVYNLPPWMCMKDPYMFLTMVIPGHPGKDIDVFLRPLIDELLVLWKDGVQAFDASRKQNFTMRAALLWTISDLPAYANLSGWCTQGHLACPHCMESSKAFQLKNGRKTSFFDCHRRFLPRSHRFRRDKDSFRKGVAVDEDPPPILSGAEMYSRVCKLPKVVFGKLHKKKRIEGYGKKHHWLKKSIFWDLPYWRTNLIRHNLDVMHCEKNVFENIWNIVMDVRDKTKDNAKARQDLKSICKRPKLELFDRGGKTIKPKATYTLTKLQQEVVYQWLKDLKLPDGYASNISKCVKVEERVCSGLKSHDCHVILQKLLPVALRYLVPTPVWDALTEVSNFFRDICAQVLNVDQLKVIKENIVVTLCKLEKIFPPAFFDPCVHLMVHLPMEAIVGGPVRYRWMYCFERYLQKLKKSVRNKACVEASICEAYLIEEASTFCSLYFEPSIQTRINQAPRNDDLDDVAMDGRLSVFCHPGRPFGRIHESWRMTDREEHLAQTYVLLNTPEMEPYIREFEDCKRRLDSQICGEALEALRDAEFCEWMKEYVKTHRNVDKRIYEIGIGPAGHVKRYKGYFVNGFKFHTEEHGLHKCTVNSGVCIKGSYYNDDDGDYYGKLLDIWQLDYFGSGNSVVLFKCHWYDTTKKLRIHPQHGLADIDHCSRFPTDEPFVLASQAHQVYYMSYPGRKKDRQQLRAICKTKARSRYDLPSGGDQSENIGVDDLYQEDDIYHDDGDTIPAIVDIGVSLDDHAILVDHESEGTEVAFEEIRTTTPPIDEGESGFEGEEGLWLSDESNDTDGAAELAGFMDFEMTGEDSIENEEDPEGDYCSNMSDDADS